MIFAAMAIAGLVQGIMSAQQAKAQATMQQMQVDRQNFIGQLQNQQGLFNESQRYQHELEQKYAARAEALEQKVLQELYTRLAYDNQMSALSKQTHQVNENIISSFSGRGVSGSSGNARAIMRNQLEAASKNAMVLKSNERNTMRDISNRYESVVNATKDSFNMAQQTFVPSNRDILDNSAAAFLGPLASGVMSGATAQYQWNNR